DRRGPGEATAAYDGYEGLDLVDLHAISISDDHSQFYALDTWQGPRYLAGQGGASCSTTRFLPVRSFVTAPTCACDWPRAFTPGPWPAWTSPPSPRSSASPTSSRRPPVRRRNRSPFFAG